MRLSKEMVEGMGEHPVRSISDSGSTVTVPSSHSGGTKLQLYCELYWLEFVLCEFVLLRSANLFLNLFSLMLDSGVPDIALEPDKTVQKVC